MADEPVIAGLLAKRTELEEAVADLEYELRPERVNDFDTAGVGI